MSNNDESQSFKQIGKQALQDLLNNLTQAKQFALAQAPDFCQQIVRHGVIMPFATGCAILTAALATLSVTAYAIYRSSLHVNVEANADKCSGWYFLVFFGALFSCILVGVGMNWLLDALSVRVAPKVYLVKKLREML
jgi:hypothetical protein